MRAEEFGERFDRLVAEPLAEVGFEPWGRSLWFEQRGLRAAVLRTERYFTWPFELTLVVSHDFVRDFDDRVPAPRGHEPNQYPIAIEPSRATQLLRRRWRYAPTYMRPPSDVMDAEHLDRQLGQISAALGETFPAVIDALTPERMVRQLRRAHDGGWCQDRWIEDYSAAAPGGRGLRALRSA